jgi:hypothetical protein
MSVKTSQVVSPSAAGASKIKLRNSHAIKVKKIKEEITVLQPKEIEAIYRAKCKDRGLDFSKMQP